MEEVAECPSDIPREETLDGDGVRSMSARTWLPSFLIKDRDYGPGMQSEQLFQQELSLAAGPVVVAGLGAPKEKAGWGRVVIARPYPQGYCVVNSLHANLPAEVTLSLADSWRSTDGRFAILLFKFHLENDKGPPENWWATLGTDGHRAWIALGRPPQHLLIAPKVTFFRNGKDLYLDIHQRYVTRLRLGADGHFIVPPPAK